MKRTKLSRKVAARITVRRLCFSDFYFIQLIKPLFVGFKIKRNIACGIVVEACTAGCFPSDDKHTLFGIENRELAELFNKTNSCFL